MQLIMLQKTHLFLPESLTTVQVLRRMKMPLGMDGPLTAKIPHRGSYDEDDVEKRRQWVETFTGTHLEHVNGNHSGLL